MRTATDDSIRSEVTEPEGLISVFESCLRVSARLAQTFECMQLVGRNAPPDAVLAVLLRHLTGDGYAATAAGRLVRV